MTALLEKKEMSERIASSCGNLYDTTSLLLQYCNGEFTFELLAALSRPVLILTVAHCWDCRFACTCLQVPYQFTRNRDVARATDY